MIAASLLLVAALVADIDFSDREAGVLRDRAHPGAVPGRAPTANAYGRFPGADAVAAYATGRDGRRSAIVTGSARKGAASPALLLPGAAALPAKGSSTQVFWFNVLGRPSEKSGVVLLDCAMGWRAGYRLEWACYGSGDAWHGIVTLTLGVGPGESHKSLSTERKVTTPGGVAGDVWHQVALVQDAQAVRFYLDGRLVDSVVGAFRTEDRPLAVRIGMRGNGAAFKTDAFRVYDEVWSAARVAADWQTGKSAAKENVVAARPQLVGAEDGVCETGRVVRIVRGGREVATRVFVRPGVTNFVYEGYSFPLCVVPRFPKAGARGVGAVELTTEQPALLRLGVRTSLVRVSRGALEPAPGVYDWRALDRRVEACRAEGVEPVLAMADGEAVSSRLARLLAARYGAAFVREDELVLVSLASDPQTLGRRLDVAVATGRRVFLTPQAHVWQGVWADAYRGYPTTSLLALAVWLDEAVGEFARKTATTSTRPRSSARWRRGPTFSSSCVRAASASRLRVQGTRVGAARRG